MRFGEKISNSWMLTKACFKVLWENPKLLVFPVLSFVATAIIIMGFMGFTMSTLVFSAILGNGGGIVLLLNIIGWVLMYYLVVFVGIFSNVAIVGSAGMMLEGKRPMVSDGLRFGISRIGPIIGWTLVTGTVSIVLQMLRSKAGNIGKVIIGLIGVVWTILTYFVVPVIVFEGLGPFKAISRSKDILKKVWGESLITNFGIGTVMGLAALVIVLLLLPVGFIMFALGPLGIVIFLMVVIMVIAFFALVNAALKGILMATLYKFARTGRSSFDIPKESLRNMFGQKKQGIRGLFQS